MDIQICQLTQEDIAKADLKQINHLLNILDQDINPLSIHQLKEVLTQDNFYLFVTKDQEKIIGMASIYFQKILSKKTAWVEDVVVDENYQGQGLGKKLVLKLIEKAKALQTDNIYLTSRSQRVAANKLYQKLGWQKKETNVYRLKFD